MVSGMGSWAAQNGVVENVFEGFNYDSTVQDMIPTGKRHFDPIVQGRMSVLKRDISQIL